jgi:small-conductance mechanosensitive channel
MARIRRLPITLADLGLALIYLISTVTLARRLPAVLDMILLERFHLSSGSRYTVTTLTTYGIVAGGTLLTLYTLGAQWSQVQWLAAALSVGIGFGLQEIVANFISGLIILFERPVRVGDMITVGNTDGVVTKIRIRATTIRNADNQELLVPNKEFITGRLLNWSLSDPVTRVKVSVGVAYGTDIDRAHALMREAADEHAHVLADPGPSVSFDAFGDNSLTLTLRAFVDDLDHRANDGDRPAQGDQPQVRAGGNRHGLPAAGSALRRELAAAGDHRRRQAGEARRGESALARTRRRLHAQHLDQQGRDPAFSWPRRRPKGRRGHYVRHRTDPACSSRYAVPWCVPLFSQPGWMFAYRLRR